MKNIRMIVSAAVVLAVVGGALAFKVPGQKLFVCNTSTSKCVLTDGTHDYQIGGTTSISNASLSASDLSGKACDPNCNGTIFAETE